MERPQLVLVLLVAIGLALSGFFYGANQKSLLSKQHKQDLLQQKEDLSSEIEKLKQQLGTGSGPTGPPRTWSVMVRGSLARCSAMRGPVRRPTPRLSGPAPTRCCNCNAIPIALARGRSRVVTCGPEDSGGARETSDEAGVGLRRGG